MNELVKQKLTRQFDKVCICGTSDSKGLIPFHISDMEFWGVNNLYAFTPKTVQGFPYHRWFEIHQFQYDGKIYLRRGKRDFRGKAVEEYLRELNGLNVPIYMHPDNPPLPIIPNAVPFPVRDLTARFGTYFTNTVTWEICFAIMLGFKEIQIYGVDMAVDTEYYFQRPSVEWAIGLAMGLGIKVYVPPEADLMKTRFMYAIEEMKEAEFSLKCKNILQGMQERANNSAMARDMENRKFEQYQGAMQAVKEVMKIWESCKPKRDE